MINLKPERVWNYFYEITQVPRPSKKEEKIRAYLREFAEKNSLPCKEDAKGNIVISRPAASKYKDMPAVILQSHMDMVCEKDAGMDFDFDTQPIEAYVDGEWVRAKGTTLGADCGIGMALQMAVLTDPDLEICAIEALFTVDEEQGLTGAKEIGTDMLTGKLMLNLDSEDEGEIFIGCAGGIDTVATMDANFVDAPSPDKYDFYKVTVGGLKGGHSGDDIEKGLACANKLLNRQLLLLLNEFEAEICDINGGNLRNAIARDAYAVVAIPKANTPEAVRRVESLAKDIQNEFRVTDPGIVITIQETGKADRCMNQEIAGKLVRTLQSVPHGIQAMSFTLPGLVETSTNLASVKIEGDKIVITTSQRSSVESAKFDIADTVRCVFELAGAEVEHSDGYPGWAPNPDSPLVKKSAEIYKKMFDKEPAVKAIHAGLECGLFLTKYPDLDIISFGPTVRGAHSPAERVEIEAVQKTWDYLKELLKAISE